MYSLLESEHLTHLLLLGMGKYNIKTLQQYHTANQLYWNQSLYYSCFCRAWALKNSIIILKCSVVLCEVY
jgi:hypothetical protein